MKKTMLMLLLTVLTLSWAQAQTIDEMMASARKMRELNNEPLAYSKYVEVLARDPKNYEALCGASFLSSRIGNRQEDNEQKANYFRNSEKFANEAVKVNPNDAEGYFVLAVAKGRMAEISGSKERVAASTHIKANAEKALQLNPKHAGAWHILGKWNIRVANLNFAEKAAADVLFGGLPKGASNENAISCFNNAIKYRPDYILYHYDLAAAYFIAGKKDQCRAELNKVIVMKAQTPDDPGYIEDAKSQLEDL